MDCLADEDSRILIDIAVDMLYIYNRSFVVTIIR
jgi:hypothetical protein